jgi:hypothetical protein
VIAIDKVAYWIEIAEQDIIAANHAKIKTVSICGLHVSPSR